MADMYNTTFSSSSSAPELDDISSFLHALAHHSAQSPLFSGTERLVMDRISAAGSTSGLNSFSGAIFSSVDQFSVTATNVSSSSVGAFQTDPNEYDSESEEGLDPMVEEVPAKPVPVVPRNSVKRSRAAEVHNLSEKRRRSRINEKLKALQNLIPNSNKTDKASMLDEAIEYLKQLQLQVQMLTMRNRLSLCPVYLPVESQPTQLTQMKMNSLFEGNELLNLNLTEMLSANQSSPTNNLNISHQSINCSAQPQVASLSSMINCKTPFGPKPSHPRPNDLETSSQEMCREEMLSPQHLNVYHTETKSLAEARASIQYDSGM